MSVVSRVGKAAGGKRDILGEVMIVEEKITGTLCRFHPDESDPEYTASWIVTDLGEIKGFSMTKINRKFGPEFAAWVQAQNRPLKVVTAIRGIHNILKRFNFIELVKE